MADIPGFKNIRLLAQKPVAIGHWTASDATVYTMEVTFEDDSRVNVSLDKRTHDLLRQHMAMQQGVGLEERMAARGAVTLSGEAKVPTREEVLPLDASGQQVRDALLRVAGCELEQELDELARTDPAVGAAAKKLDDVRRAIISKGRKA